MRTTICHHTLRLFRHRPQATRPQVFLPLHQHRSQGRPHMATPTHNGPRLMITGHTPPHNKFHMALLAMATSPKCMRRRRTRTAPPIILVRPHTQLVQRTTYIRRMGRPGIMREPVQLATQQLKPSTGTVPFSGRGHIKDLAQNPHRISGHLRRNQWHNSNHHHQWSRLVKPPDILLRPSRSAVDQTFQRIEQFLRRVQRRLNLQILRTTTALQGRQHLSLNRNASPLLQTLPVRPQPTNQLPSKLTLALLHVFLKTNSWRF